MTFVGPFYSFQQYKNFENRLRFDTVRGKKWLILTFWITLYIYICVCVCGLAQRTKDTVKGIGQITSMRYTLGTELLWQHFCWNNISRLVVLYTESDVVWITTLRWHDIQLSMAENWFIQQHSHVLQHLILCFINCHGKRWRHRKLPLSQRTWQTGTSVGWWQRDPWDEQNIA